MILTLTAAALPIIGIAITGFYPGIIVLLFLTLIPIASFIILPLSTFTRPLIFF